MPGKGRPFQPGNPGKPKGAVSKRPFKAELLRQLRGDTLVRVIKAAVDAAIGGDVSALKLIRDTLDGLPVQQIDLADGRVADIRELSDQELIAIASTSGSGTADAPAGKKEPDLFH
jgi:hypothetical protein